MVTRITLLLFLFSTALHLGAQIRITTTDLLYIKQRMQIGTDTSKNFTSIVDTITAASTHHQAPSALAVYEAIAEYGGGGGGGGGHVILEGDTPRAQKDSLEFQSNSSIIFGATNTSTRTVVDATLESNSVGAAEIAADAVGNSELASDAVDSTNIVVGGVSVTDIGQHGASSGQVLKWNGTQWAPAADTDAQTLTLDSTLLTSLERFSVGISGGNTVHLDVPRATLDTFSLSGTTLSASVSTDVFPAYTVSFSGWDTDASNDITGTLSAGQVPYATGAQTVAGSNNLWYNSPSLTINSSTDDTLLVLTRNHLNPFGIHQFTDPYNGSTIAYRIGGLDGRRVFLKGYGLYPEAPFYQQETAGIGFAGTTGTLRLHTNGDYYTATVTGDNGTTNRNVSYYFVSGGATYGFGNPVVFHNVFANNDSTANGFEFLLRNTASGGVTIRDSTLFGITAWDRGRQFTLTNGGRLGLQTHNPLYSFDVNDTDGIRLPRGTTAQRPAGTPAGVVRFNTDSTALEVATGSAWTTLGSGGGGGTDNWGSQVVEKDATLTGNGTSGSPLGVASAGLDSTHLKTGGVSVTDLGQHGASSGQALKWNGTQWAPGSVNVTNEVSGRLQLSNLVQGSSLSVLGVPGSSAADMESIQAGTDHQVLRRSGTALGFGAINLASSNAVSGLLPVANLAAGAIVDGGNTTAATVTIGTNDANALNLEVNDTTGVVLGTDRTFTATASVANTNSVFDQVIIRNNSGGTPANGFGTGLAYYGESSTTDNQFMARFATSWSTATHASRTSDFGIYVVNAGATVQGATIRGATNPYITIGSGSTQYLNSGITTANSYIIGNSSQVLSLISTSSNVNGGVQLSNNSTTASKAISVRSSVGQTSTSLSRTELYVDAGGYTASSGSGTHNLLTLSNTYNLTGTASGIQAGLTIIPTLTSLANAQFWGVHLNYNDAKSKGVYQPGPLTTNNFVGKTAFGATGTPTDAVDITGNLNLTTAGNKIKIATGSNASVGTATLVAGTVTVSTTAVTSSSKIFISRNTTGGTLGHLSVPDASITNATSFVINSSDSGDTSTVNWFIIN